MHLSRRAVLAAAAPQPSRSASPRALTRRRKARASTRCLSASRPKSCAVRPSAQHRSALAKSARADGHFDRVSDASKAGNRRARSLTQRALRDRTRIDREALSASEQVTYDVVRASSENSLAANAFEMGSGATAPYVVTQLTGVYSNVPSFLPSSIPCAHATRPTR